MLPTIKIKSDDVTAKARREAAAQRVIAHFDNQLPNTRLLCFFDDEDCEAVKEEVGEANRGLFMRVERVCLWGYLPEYVRVCAFSGDCSDFPSYAEPPVTPVFDHLIYLHGSTCSNDVGLTMTFAHELQHFVQHGNVRQLWAANSLIGKLRQQLNNDLGLRQFHIPTEREARIVSKQTTSAIFGGEHVKQFIESKIPHAVDDKDKADWQSIQSLVTSTPYDLASETRLIFQRLKGYRGDFEKLLQELKDDPDFNDIDLDDLFNGV